MVKREYSRMPKQGVMHVRFSVLFDHIQNRLVTLTFETESCLFSSQEVEKKIEELKVVCADLRKEIGQRQMETKTLKEELDKRNRQIQKEKKEYDASNEEVEKLKVPIQANRSIKNVLLQ